jgi:hypothetical protein
LQSFEQNLRFSSKLKIQPSFIALITRQGTIRSIFLDSQALSQLTAHDTLLPERQSFLEWPRLLFA